MVEEVWNDAGYDFWAIVPIEAWDDLLMTFAKQFLADNDKATDRLREICKKHGVQQRLG